MRIATTIISLVLTVILLVQSWAVHVGGSISNNALTEQGGAVGVLVALLFLIGGAFVLGIPLVSVVAFALGALLAFWAGTTTPYGDLVIWGFAGLVFAAMSFFGHLGKYRNRRESQVQ